MMRSKSQLVQLARSARCHRLARFDPFDRDRLVRLNPFDRYHRRQPDRLGQSGLRAQVGNMGLVEANNRHRMVDSTCDSLFADTNMANISHNLVSCMNNQLVVWNRRRSVVGAVATLGIPLT